MKKMEYVITASEFHGGREWGRTSTLAAARKVADCGSCRCGGGSISLSGLDVIKAAYEWDGYLWAVDRSGKVWPVAKDIEAAVIDRLEAAAT